MINFSECHGLFAQSAFFALKKGEPLDPQLIEIQKQLRLCSNIENFHPQRRQEFVLGRLCAYKAHFQLLGTGLLELPMGGNRQPIWPSSIVGSISHDKNWVGAAVAKKESLQGLGIDFEIMGRTKPELTGHITNERDLQSVPGLSDVELLTLIFSAKEALYKALYPLVNKFFGFDAAAVTALCQENKKFTIELLVPLSEEFSPLRRCKFSGRYERDRESCLTVIEVPYA